MNEENDFSSSKFKTVRKFYEQKCSLNESNSDTNFNRSSYDNSQSKLDSNSGLKIFEIIHTKEDFEKIAEKYIDQNLNKN